MKNWMLGLSCLGLVACSDGTGNVTFTTYGEDYIEKEIPAAVGEEAGFVDGWTVRFSKFVVVLSEVKVKTQDDVAAQQTQARVFDVHKPGPVVVESFKDLDAREWDDISYAIAPVASAVAGNADAQDVERMKTEGLSLLVVGTATKGGVTKQFDWGFKTNTLYERCESPELGAGVTVPKDGEETVQLTIHGDHLFFDDLQSPDAKMRFDAMAAADRLGIAGPDGVVTLEELATVDLTELPAEQYGTGGAGNVRNLRDFVTALVRTAGHFRGEGECSPKAR
ncbi:hypothetical protein HUA74_35685 [Myxococcus sp. CA051A]|uniref:Lipoprotein n=1 Tax=Myxococcus llanfairpwllgwyngyllgogerychwyrndrobwllllantysiliogogogochensis TaxID=2590453 RepID=A0A540X2N7_9BACT|nr:MULTISPECIES: hypothetical protein [Myxococcus]NTX10677.1 hypothetical protein [Myxococcus sp. CA056]NTX41377.1 hypothetical protein [Myxococcus sp. CA033]NTX50701.1 hypothetical protein [Myxococcus sp. CA039A]NTX66012.1 hypothetical protein [Myxococcus sp. CA051A]TQF15521.1 hypothetical protein FJV41_12950 [Myxococcus llanfairpwllgwyngyllgogerychwyrndrobwllllantysiliogogogochensis]